MYEEHPPLVNVRSIYIDFLAPYMSHRDYLDRKILAQYVNGEIALDGGPLKSAVDRLNVHTIVIADNLPFYEADQHALTSAGFLLKRQSGAYTVWTRNY
ncbi:hypothetical protein GCM10010872_07210 [Dyella flava]|nr:hypothetical protein GCM10010872_07210 [Dyella flava]